MSSLTKISTFWHICNVTFLILCSFNIQATAIIGHRGARGLFPEGTLESYKAAIMLGVAYIDMDIVMTKDHHLVVYHDLGLNPMITRDKDGAWIKKPILIKELNLKELKLFNIGAIKPNTFYHQLFKAQRPLNYASIPTLEEVVSYARKLNPHIKFQIEIKTDPAHPKTSFPPKLIAKKLVLVLNKLAINDKVRIQAFDWRCLYAIQALNPRLPTAYLTSHAHEILMRNKNKHIAGLWTGGNLLANYHSLPAMIKALGGHAWDPESHSLTKSKHLEATALGLSVFVWFDSSLKFNESLEIKRLLGLKVAGIITDRPDLANRQIILTPQHRRKS